MKNVLIIFLLLITSGIGAQGKFNFKCKNTFGYSNTILHINNFLSPKTNKHNFTYQRIFNRRTAFIFNYGFSQSQFDFNQNISLRNSNRTITGAENSYFRTKFYDFGVRKYIYEKGAIAPFGTFIEIKIGKNLIKRNPKDSILYYSGDKRFYGEMPTTGRTKLNFLNFQIGVGSSKPLTKNISFVWLLNLTGNIPMWTRPGQNVNYLEYEDEYYFQNASVHHQLNNIINLSIGLNYSF